MAAWRQERAKEFDEQTSLESWKSNVFTHTQIQPFSVVAFAFPWILPSSWPLLLESGQAECDIGPHCLPLQKECKKTGQNKKQYTISTQVWIQIYKITQNIHKILEQVVKLTYLTPSPTFIEPFHVPSIALATKTKASKPFSLASYHWLSLT